MGVLARLYQFIYEFLYTIDRPHVFWTVFFPPNFCDILPRPSVDCKAPAPTANDKDFDIPQLECVDLYGPLVHAPEGTTVWNNK